MWSYHLTRSTLQWRHNGRDGVSNHRRLDCLLNRLSWRKSKKTWKVRVTGLCEGTSPWPVNSPHKGPVTRKMSPFDDVIMDILLFIWCGYNHPAYWTIQVTFSFVVNLNIYASSSRTVSRGILWFNIAWNPIDVPPNRIIAGGIELEMSLYDEWHSQSCHSARLLPKWSVNV